MRRYLKSLLLAPLLTAGAAMAGPEDLLPMPDLPTMPAVTTVKPVARDAGVTEKLGRAMITPLTDLNMVREEIPEVLETARKGPYQWPFEEGCARLQDAIDGLDMALGRDIDTPVPVASTDLVDKGLNLAENSGVGMVKRTMEDLVPFRSWLRKLSGAESHSKQIAAAIQAGHMRRAYLKGLRAGLRCPPPVVLTAAPAPAGPPAPAPQAQAQASTNAAPAPAPTHTTSTAAPTTSTVVAAVAPMPTASSAADAPPPPAP